MLTWVEIPDGEVASFEQHLLHETLKEVLSHPCHWILSAEIGCKEALEGDYVLLQKTVAHHVGDVL